MSRSSLGRTKRRLRGRFGERTSPGSGVLVSSAPIVANQSADFGALTAADDGGFMPIVSGGAVTSASIDSGNTGTHFQISSTGVITPTAAGDTADLASGPYSLGCTFTNAEGSDTATITVTAIANARSVAPSTNEAEWETAVEASAYGDSVLMRSGDYNSSRGTVVAARAGSTAAYVRPSNLDVDSDDVAGRRGLNFTTGTVIKVTAHSGATPIWHSMEFSNSNSGSKGIVVEDVTFAHSGAVSSGGQSLLNTAGAPHDDFFVYNCSFTGNPNFDGTGDDLISGILTVAGDWLHVQDCTFDFLSTGMTIAAGDDCGAVGNTLTNIFDDGIKIGGGSRLRINYNSVSPKDSQLNVPEIHGDLIQVQLSSGVDAADCQFIGNEGWAQIDPTASIGEGVVGQGMFINLNGTPTDARFTDPVIAGNFIAVDAVHSISVADSDGAQVRYNSISEGVDYSSTGERAILAIETVGAPASTTAVIRNNVASAMPTNLDADSDVGGNVTWDKDNKQTSIEALFADAQIKESLTTPRTMFLPKTSGSLDVDNLIGCYGDTDIIDHANKITDFPFEEAGFSANVDWGNLVGQATSTLVQSANEPAVTGVSSTGTEVWLTGGNSPQFQVRLISDDTVVRAYGTDRFPCTTAHKIKLQDTTDASTGVTDTITVHAGLGTTGTWQIDTVTFTEEGVTFDGTNDYGTRTSNADWDSTSDASAALIFASCEFAGTAAADEYIYTQDDFSHFLVRNVNGEIRLAWRDNTPAGVVNMTSTLTVGAERCAILGRLELGSGNSELYVWRSSTSTWTQFATDTSTGTGTLDLTVGFPGICALSNGNNKFTGDMYRLAMWYGVDQDVSSSTVQDNFINSSTGALIIPSTSVTAYGTPKFDLYGDAAFWNDDGSNNNGDGGGYNMNGAVVDV